MRPIVWVGALLVLSACNSTNNEALKKLQEGCLLDSDCETPLVCAFRRCHVRCNEDRDCPTGQACRPADRPYNVCVAKLECTRDSDCDPGLVCAADNICRSECQANRDCLADQICIAGVCAREAELANGQLPRKSDAGTFACNYNSECPPAQVCNRGRCLPECVTNADCSFGFSCNKGACTPLDGGGSSCNLNSDCNGPTPQICSVNGLCIAECVDARDCRADQTCTNSRCVSKGSDGGTACALNSDCMDPKFPRCGPQGVCGPECRDNRDCAPPAVCALGDAGFGNCRVPGSDGGTAPSCSLNSDCTDPQFPRCSPQGRCVVDCYFNVDCGPGFTCVGAVTDAGVNNKGGACTPMQSATDGGSSQPCNLNSDCTNPDFPRCGPQGRCTVDCYFNLDCSSGTVCVGAVTDGGTPDGGWKGGRCQLPPTGTGDVGASCQLNSNCRPGLECNQGTCSYQCVNDSDCNASLNQCCIYFQCNTFQTCLQRTQDGGLPPRPDGGVDAGNVDAGCNKDLDCQDGVFCNGAEFCQSGACRQASRAACDDNNPCSLDSCSEANKTCSYASTLVDSDGDGHYPVTCGGNADDCDDTNAFTWGGAFPAPERCDFKDNNCNGNVDEGLWAEKPNSRSLVYPGGLYPPHVTGPRLLRIGNDLFIAAASDGTARGSVDVFRLEAATLNLVTGPAAAVASASPNVSCVSPTGNQAGQTIAQRRAGRHELYYSDAGEVMVGGAVKTFFGPACCPSSPARQSTAYGRSPLSPFSFDGGELFADNNGFAVNVCPFFDNQLIDPPSLAWNARIGKWLAVYPGPQEITGHPGYTCGSNDSNCIQTRALFSTTIAADGSRTTPRRLVDGTPTQQGAYVPSNYNTESRNTPRVVVGPSNVLVIWDQERTQNGAFAGRPRFAFFSDDLTQVVGGPFDLPVAALGLNINQRDFENALWDDPNYLLLVSQGASAQASVVRLSPTGAAVGPPQRLPSPGSQSSSAFDLIPSSSASSIALSNGSVGLFAAVTSPTGVRFAWGLNKPGAPLLNIDVSLGLTPNQHSDFQIAPMDDKNVAIFYQDGDLRRLVMECKP